MTTTTEEHHSHTTEELEAELEEMRHELEKKRGANGFVQLAAVFAVLLAMAALIAVTLKLGNSENATSAMHNQMNAQANGAGMMGAGSGAASDQSTGAAAEVVKAQLGDYSVTPSTTSVPAGKVTFDATNVGQVPHELMIERMPIKMDAPGQPNEDAAQGMINDMGPGQSGSMTLNLKPGNYELFCNVPGHYAMGQHTMFKVTG